MKAQEARYAESRDIQTAPRIAQRVRAFPYPGNHGDHEMQVSARCHSLTYSLFSAQRPILPAV